MIEYIWRANNLDVHYTNETNGGGDYFAIEYIDTVNHFYGKVNHILEWCSGPGFIGYGMFAYGLCEHVSFIDKYYPAIEQLQITAHKNNIKDQVSIMHGDCLSSFDKDNKFDLIIGNPPHWSSIEDASNSLSHSNFNDHLLDILVDKDWHDHRKFFEQAKIRLNDNGVIFLQENWTGSNPDSFNQIVQDNALKINSYSKSNMYENIYYLEVVHA